VISKAPAKEGPPAFAEVVISIAAAAAEIPSFFDCVFHRFTP